jgi:3-hydroxyisobutyrate dehydrogenase-like beta-hydroxyacid dehydrogenase
MSITVAIVAQGSMGSGVGKRLHENGAEVRTLLSGRSAASAERVAAIIAPTGAAFVDAGIIGGPPRPGYSPAIYASGQAVGETKVLRDWGLDWRAIDGPVGAASGLKMSYAGITKGITALGSSMMLGAARFGCAEALVAELSQSQPQIFKYLSASIPRMYDKAYRWVAEMEEISDFHGSYKPAADIYAAIARHYEALAAAEAENSPGPNNPVKTLDRVLGR